MRLVEPSAAYLPSYQKAFEEYQANQVTTHSFLNPRKVDVLDHICRYREGRNIPTHHVSSTCLWLVEKDEFIGEIWIRHALTDALLRLGGHIGYGIRFSRWNQGLGTKMLAMTLQYVQENFDFDRVLITCNDDNIGSARVIEKNGGVLQDKIENTLDGRTFLTRRYWVDLNPAYSRCGMRCDLCLIYRPNVEKCDRRSEICNVWQKVWPGFQCDPAAVICDGCRSCAEAAVLFSPDCKTRRCVMEKGLEHCGWCSEYPCASFPAEPTQEELIQKIEMDRQWTWEDERLMDAYSCKRNMDAFRLRQTCGKMEMVNDHERF